MKTKNRIVKDAFLIMATDSPIFIPGNAGLTVYPALSQKTKTPHLGSRNGVLVMRFHRLPSMRVAHRQAWGNAKSKTEFLKKVKIAPTPLGWGLWRNKTS
jgi:hypothetical protein